MGVEDHFASNKDESVQVYHASEVVGGVGADQGATTHAHPTLQKHTHRRDYDANEKAFDSPAAVGVGVTPVGVSPVGEGYMTSPKDSIVIEMTTYPEPMPLSVTPSHPHPRAPKSTTSPANTQATPPPHVPMLYVVAPEGYFPLAGCPDVVCVPNGQLLTTPEQAVHVMREDPYMRRSALIGLIHYLLGFFILPCQVVSIAVSLHMARRGNISWRATPIVPLCLLELFVFIFAVIALLAWHNWAAGVVYVFSEVVFGIPRIVHTWRLGHKRTC